VTTGAIRVVIAEDEPAARRHLARLVGRDARFRVVAQAESGTEALTLARDVAPDLLLLDIQMPGADGFDVVRGLSGPAMPLVVFVTAHDDYAVRAFEVHAVDYILKPFDDGRVARALEMVHARLDARSATEMRERLGSLVGAAVPERRPPPGAARLALAVRGGMVFVPVGAITHITADGYCAVIHTTRRTHHVRESLLSLAARLPADFARVHRSAIVNLAAITSLEPLTHGEARITLAGGAAVKVSRSYRAALSPLFP
jgi:two-component system LytT family response regulator